MAVVFLVSLLLQIKPPTITGKRFFQFHFVGILSTKCIIPSLRWKRSVEENSEAWSLDLGLRMLGVKEVSCKRRLVRLNMSFIEEMKKKPSAYKQLGV